MVCCMYIYLYMCFYIFIYTYTASNNNMQIIIFLIIPTTSWTNCPGILKLCNNTCVYKSGHSQRNLCC